MGIREEITPKQPALLLTPSPCYLRRLRMRMRKTRKQKIETVGYYVVVIVVVVCLVLSIWSAIGWVVWKVLAHFGII